MNELELLEKSKTDEKAVEKLLTMYKPLVLKIARGYFIVGEEIDDIVQEGMIGLYKAINSYEEEKAGFKTFATLCIKRQILSAIKKANTNKSKMFWDLCDDQTLDFFLAPSNKENPENKIISKENYNLLNSTIQNSLSDLEKSVLKEYLAGGKYEEIANKLGMEKKSVDNALNRIRNKLLHLLDDINL
jgi:RNA polymerase sporulation-specific sigma factor